MRLVRNIILVLVTLAATQCTSPYEDFPVPPASTVPQFTFTVANDGLAPAQVSFANTSIIPEEAGTYILNWDFGDGNRSAEENPTHTFTAAAKYTVRLEVITQREISQAEATVTVFAPAASGTAVFFSDRNTGTLQKALLNSDAPTNRTLGADAYASPYSMVVDADGDKVYVADQSSGEIYRMDYDGENRELFRSGLAGPAGLAIDPNGGHLYWTTDDAIERAALNSTDVSQKEVFASDVANDPEGLSVDASNSKVYWVTYDGSLWVKNTDGTGETELLADVLGASVLAHGDKLYFHSYDLGTSEHTLKMANLDGTNATIIDSGMDGDVYGLVYDAGTDKIYYTNQRGGQILRANPDGSGKEVWLNDRNLRIYALAIGEFEE